MNVACPQCASVFRVDPAKVPAGGVRARCSICGGIIPVPEPHIAVATPAGGVSAMATPATGVRPITTPAAGSPSAAGQASEVSPADTGPTDTGPTDTWPTDTWPTDVQPTEMPPTGITPTDVQQAGIQPAGAPPVDLPAAEVQPPATISAETPAASAASAAAPEVEMEAEEPPPAPAEPSATEQPAAPTTGTHVNPYLARDPQLRAKRLARALASDIVTYYPDKHAEAVRDGTFDELFSEEIKKSYEDYVSQVGAELAESTTYFQDALNEVLARGKRVF